MSCAIAGCERSAVKRGWCIPHYKRWQRHGDPLAGASFRTPGRICDIEDCGNPHVGHGYCSKHLARWRAGNDPAAPTWRDLTPDERFWRNVNKDGPLPEGKPELGPCWVWTAAKNGNGYGAFSPGGGVAALAHRWIPGYAASYYQMLVKFDCQRPS